MKNSRGFGFFLIDWPIKPALYPFYVWKDPYLGKKVSQVYN